jgi:hypothetical protein
MRAVSRIAFEAPCAIGATNVDLSNHPAPEKRAVRRFNYATYELVPECAAESGIALHNFKVGIANAGADHLNQRFAFASRQAGCAHELEFAVKPQSVHFCFRYSAIA